MASVLRELKRYVRRFEPCLPRPAKQPGGKDWIHEIKHDGFRIMAWRDGNEVRLLSRKAMILLIVSGMLRKMAVGSWRVAIERDRANEISVG